MVEETEIQVKEESHDFENEEQGEISNEALELDIKEPQKQVPVENILFDSTGKYPKCFV
jgi:hypothetical protein